MAYIRNPLQAASYSKFRPVPPMDLIEKIIYFLKGKTCLDKLPGQALDVGCGSGQSTEILSPFFKHVIGLDNCKEQLLYAQESTKHQNVTYRLSSAEKLPVLDGSTDLVTVGMAIHWFNLQQFCEEVSRVLRPNGVLAVYGYNLPQPTVNDISLSNTVELLFSSTLGHYMPDQSKLVYIDGYKGQQFSQFPFSSQPTLRCEFPSVEQKASFEDLVGYIRSTSSFQNYLEKHGEAGARGILFDFKSQVAEQLGGHVDLEEVAFNITFPYFLLLSRKDI